MRIVKNRISPRDKRTEKQSNDKENNVYPDAPSPALLRVPLSLGTFFISLIAKKCSQNTRRSCHDAVERKTELAAVGVISDDPQK